MSTEVVDTVFSSEPLQDFQPREDARRVCDELQPLLIEVRRHLRMHPEVGFQEFETSKYIRSVLEAHGFEPVTIAETGLYVDIKGDQPGPTVAYRADIDALPSQDEILAPYASRTPGVGHLCGHDAHTSMGIGVALLLNRLRSYIKGTVRVFFQPNEEGMPSGAPELMKEGILDNVSAAYAVHVDPTVDSGSYGLIAGAATAAADRFDVIVDSKTTGHSARPHNTVDTVWVATQIANTLYQLSGRVTDPRHPSILTVCRFQAGRAYNVIPSSVTLGGTLRCTDHNVRKQLKDRLIHTAVDIGETAGVEVRVEYHDGAPPVINDPSLISRIGATIRNIGNADNAEYLELPSMGAEDFAHYLVYVPGAMVRVGTRRDQTTSFPLHDANFDIDESVLAPAAYLMTNVLLDYLSPQ
ncbi:MAG: amidohydrolase [Rhodothermales bacterium]|nr:amidohydrolase [Rhodothermales bacterium]